MVVYPDMMLNELRRAAREFESGRLDAWSAARMMSAYFDALDGHITNGGALPLEWNEV